MALEMTLDFSRCPYPPLVHQREDVEFLIAHKNFALMNEMGTGKTWEIVTSACLLFEQSEIDTVVVISPVPVKPVWLGEFGEIAKHSFVPFLTYELTSEGYERRVSTEGVTKDTRALKWLVTNYEYLGRGTGRAQGLLKLLEGKRAWVVLDETSRIASPGAAQTKAVWKLGGTQTRRRDALGRRQPPLKTPVVRKTIMNGTPVGNSPLDLYAQFRFLDPDIIGVENATHMRKKYAMELTMKNHNTGQSYPKIVGYQNLDDLERRLKPHAVRRLKKECLDLPEKIYTVREVAMTKEEWKLYREMRDTAVATLSDGNQSVSMTAGVVHLRLAQLTAGFIGGMETATPGAVPLPVREVGRANLEGTMATVAEILEQDPHAKILIWCRFRPEVQRLAKHLAMFGHPVHLLYGDQTPEERQKAIDALRPENVSARAEFVVGTAATGGLGLTFTAAHHTIYSTNDFSLINRLQSEDRVHRSGQKFPCIYYDMVVTGPKGERTISHLVREALQNKIDLASWTTGIWKRELAREL